MKPDLSIEEMWNQLQRQQKEIEALRDSQRNYKVSRLTLISIATVACMLVLGGAVYATGPVSSNVVHACFNTKSKALSVLPKGKCPSGTTAINWDQYTGVTAASPLSVTPGANGSAPRLSVTGVVPTAHNFTGSLGGDVTGSQGATKVGGLQGVPVDPSTPGTDQVLSYNGSKWAPTVSPNRLDAATLHWNPDNSYGFYTSGGNPLGIAFDGTHMWVADNSSNKVDEFDSFGNIVHTVTVGNNPFGVAYDGIYTIAVTSAGANNVYLISLLGTPAISTTVSLNDPTAICFDGRNYWVLNRGNELTELSSVGTYEGTVSTGNSLEGIACDDSGRVWTTVITSGGFTGVLAINEALKVQTVGYVALTGFNANTTLAFDGAHIWVSQPGHNEVSEIDANSYSLLKTISVGKTPEGLAFDGTHIWVANNGGNSVSEIDIASQQVIKTLGVGGGPTDVAFDGSHIWVTDTTDSDMSKL